MMNLDEAIHHCLEVAEEKRSHVPYKVYDEDKWTKEQENCMKCAEEHRQLAEWLRELKVFKSKKGQWLRMSDLSEQEDDRYRCSYCGNVIHHKDKVNLYTFNSWCGRCGSDNGRH